MLDLRVPSGWFFVILGVIVLAVGLLQPDLQAPLSEGVNVNLYSGASMLVFGAFLLILARRALRK